MAPCGKTLNAALCSVAQSCPALCDPTGCRSPDSRGPPGSSVSGIFQARMLEWVAIFFFFKTSWRTLESHVLCCFNVHFYFSSRLFSLSEYLCKNLTDFFERISPCILFVPSFPTFPLFVTVVFAQSCLTLCNSTDCSMPGLPCLHCGRIQLLWK